MLIFGEAHLRQTLSSYAAYYNGVRTHLALGKDAPLTRAVHRGRHSDLVRAAPPLRPDIIFGKHRSGSRHLRRSFLFCFQFDLIPSFRSHFQLRFEPRNDGKPAFQPYWGKLAVRNDRGIEETSASFEARSKAEAASPAYQLATHRPTRRHS
jgi:hypothetical protein